MFAYCENDAVNNSDFTGAFLWKKIWGFLKKLGNYAKIILELIVNGATTLMGIRDGFSAKEISAIAKKAGRSPHRVKQNFEWLYDRVKKLKTKTGKILKALTYILYLSNTLPKLKNFKGRVIEIVSLAIGGIISGLSALISWLVGKGVKLLSKFIPALGGVLGFLLNGFVSRIVDAFLDNKSKKIEQKYIKKVNGSTFDSGDYIITFLECLI